MIWSAITGELDLGVRGTPISELAVGTLNKLLLIGCESGHIYGIGLNSNKKVLFVNMNRVSH